MRPSPAILVYSETSIADCVRKMKQARCGSVLVASSNYPHGFVGIFTERDLVRWIEEIQQGDYWQKSVAHVMSHPLITIDIGEIDQAGEVMMKKGLRHLPVVYHDQNGIEQLAGVISMRDIFDGLVRRDVRRREARRAAVQKGLRIRVGLFASEPPAVRAWLSHNPLIEGVELGVGETMFTRLDGIIVDIDGLPPAEWASLLQRIEHDPVAAALVFFSPERHEPKHVEILRRLGGSSDKFKVFMKPLHLLPVVRELRRWTRKPA